MILAELPTVNGTMTRMGAVGLGLIGGECGHCGGQCGGKSKWAGDSLHGDLLVELNLRD